MKKHTLKYLLLLSCIVTLSCNHDENEIVPEFLDGTAFGILLDVEVTSNLTVPSATIDDYTLNFKVDQKGADKRAVSSILIHRVFVDKVDGPYTAIQEASLTTFPTTISLTATQLIDGFQNLDINDLEVGDAFNINFIINYADGGVVDRYDSSMRTNFTIAIIE